MKQLPDHFAAISLTTLPADEHAAFASAMTLGQPARGIRFRPGFSLPEYQEKIPWATYGYYLPEGLQPGNHPLHTAGGYYLQEPSAMAAVAALGVQPGQRVLDLCAAPGGKSTQAAAHLAGEGVLIANEIVASRAKILSHNIERMGVRNAIVTNESPDKLASRWGAWFDRVLVDAPCSGEGMFRREAGAASEWTPESPKGCALRQAQVLDSAALLLRPGGVMVYSTCTFNEVENEGSVRGFLSRHPDFAVEDFSLPGIGASVEGCLRLWPHRLRGEGHFIARLRKRGGDARPAATPVTATLDYPFFQREILGNQTLSGDKVWVMPVEAPPLDGIRVLRSGLAVGQHKGKVFVPDHALALAFPPDAFTQSFALDEASAAKYLHGETLLVDGLPNGWTVVSIGGLSLGWTKCVDGVLKNHLPKGLRK